MMTIEELMNATQIEESGGMAQGAGGRGGNSKEKLLDS
jgi:hypothetical protein